ncbi:MAG: hypothetical protein HXX13_14450, partial [Bacteroidetes bacterium]|nr:hypothetical protein [Bacteroidota bacterium]
MLRRFRYILILSIALLGGLRAAAQLAMPDTVCIGATKHYWVNGNPGSTYVWEINGTPLASTAFEIFQAWPFAGDYILTVQETSVDGCIGPLMSGHVIVTPAISSSTIVATCNSYTWNGNTYLTSGTYNVLFPNGSVNGCDSTAILNLTINFPVNSLTSHIACDSYLWNGSSYTSSGSYSVIFPNGSSQGCDSTANLNLTVYNSVTSTSNITACNSYTWNGTTYTISGNYTSFYAGGSANGCDSTAILNLIINNSVSTINNISACNSYTWPLNGTNYNVSGSYDYISANANGCNDTTTLVLTINNGVHTNVNQTACGSYTWPLNGTTYTVSGLYDFVSVNANGCNDTTTLVLTINNGVHTNINQTACGSYTWPLNGTTYTVSGSYDYISVNANGCNDTTTLVLTINNGITSSSSVSACGSYTW